MARVRRFVADRSTRFGLNPADEAVVDLAFGITGTVLPVDYEFGLWCELVRCLPWLESAPGAGIHPLRTAPGGEGALLLARRAKLVLRLPTTSVRDAMKLTGCMLNVGPGLAVGPGSEKALRSWATLHAHRVASQAATDTEFAWADVSRTEAVSCDAVACISVAAEDTMSM